MTDTAWRTISGRLGWFIAATFVVAMAAFALRQFHVIVPEPEFPPPDATLVDNLIRSFEHEQAHWIGDLVSSLTLAAGFVGLAILGTTLRRALDRDDAGGAVLAVIFLLGGAIGAASQVLYLGAIEVATNPGYCDCGFLAEEIISRGMARDIVNNVVFWMTDASVVLFTIGLWVFAALAPASGWVPNGLTMYARVVAVVAFLSVLWGRVAVPLLIAGRAELDFELIGGVLTLLVAGVLVPIWAAWLALSARAAAPELEETLSAGD